MDKKYDFDSHTIHIIWWINEIEIPTSADDIPEDYDRDGIF